MTEENTQKQRILVISNDNRFIREVPELSTVLPVKLTVQKGSYEALQTLRSKPANLVILDFNIPLISGEELIRLVHEAHPDTPIIVITDPLTSEQKKEIIDAGAMDFMERPFEFEELKSKVQDLMFTKTYHFQVAALRTILKKEYGLENIIGDCDEMWKVYRALGNIAKSDVTVFIQGESGTGKEVIARTIHKKSRRRNHPLITINCAAIPENLLESELFGQMTGRSFSTKSVKCHSSFRQKFSDFLKNRSLNGWAAINRSRSMSGLSRQRIKTLTKRSPPVVFAKTCSTV